MDERILEEYKGYNLGRTNSAMLISVKARGQGMVPKPLQGMYTSMGQAKKAVDSYLASLLKGKKVGSKSTKGSGTG